MFFLQFFLYLKNPKSLHKKNIVIVSLRKCVIFSLYQSECEKEMSQIFFVIAN